MRNKILGEDAVRALYFDRDGQYYTVVRPGGLSEDPGEVERVRAQPGRRGGGRVSRDDVAAICVESITREDTKNATFECYDADTAKPLGEVGFSNLIKYRRRRRPAHRSRRRGQTWDDIFTGLTPDAPGAKQQGEGFTL